MRTIIFHSLNPANEAMKVHALDGPGPGGASHVYCIGLEGPMDALDPRHLIGCRLSFQNGPVKEDGNGVNGITHEALLAVLIDRLRGFQSGPYANEFNAGALEYLAKALAILHQRTRDREARGVEGTHKV